jgi:CheY-like chemotaxis protein
MAIRYCFFCRAIIMFNFTGHLAHNSRGYARWGFSNVFLRWQSFLGQARALCQGTLEAFEEVVSAEMRNDLRSIAGPAPDGEHAFSGNPCAKLHILLVEDDPDVAESTSLILEYFGHQVAMAPNGAAALAAAQIQKPDIVLLDIRMPKMDGCELARQLRDLFQDKTPVLIGISGYGGADLEERCAAAGIDILLMKPVDPEHLRRLLQQQSKKAVAR